MLPRADRRATPLGVLVQTNFGGVLTIDGAPVGKELGRYAFAPSRPRRCRAANRGDGSCMIVVATDAPLDARDLKRLAARAVFGLARTGSSFSATAAAISRSPSRPRPTAHAATATIVARARVILPSDAVSPLFEAALEATEEAVYNSLLQATTVTGNAVSRSDPDRSAAHDPAQVRRRSMTVVDGEIWKSGDLEIWKSGIWKSEHFEIWRLHI